jgi:hypothetical protein
MKRLLRNTRTLWPAQRGWTGGFLHFLAPRPAALALLILAMHSVPAPAQQAAATTPATAPPAAESPVPSDQTWLTGYIDLGYRWVTGVGGSFDTYRSIVDLGSGPKMLGTEFTVSDPKHRYFDTINVRAFNWGDDPYSTFHLGAKKAKLYDFSVDYRNIAYYSNLPAFADPLMDINGVVLNEQSLDTHQKMSSAQLDVWPGRWIVPYLAFDHDSDTGSGIATFVSNGNEYPVASLVRSSTNNYRGGVRLELSRFHITLEEGGTTFKDDQQLNQSPGQVNYGNFFSPLLGQTLYLTGLGEAYGVRGSSIYTKGLLSANVTSWLDMYGQFLYSQPDSNVNFQEFSTGNQVLLSQVLFYAGEQSLVSAEAKLPHTSGSFGGEIRPFRRLRVLPAWLTDRMHTNSSSSTQQDLTTTTGPLALNSLLSSSLVTNYNQAEVGLMFDLTRKITLRGGYRYVWGNASDVTLPISGLGALDEGKIRRNVALAGAAWRPFEKLSINADFEGGSSGSTYFRTSLYDYQRGRLRGRYQISPSFSFSANASVLHNHNPTPGINYDFLAHQESASFVWTPAGGKYLTFEGAYTRSTVRSDINYLDPEFLTPETSLYVDNSHTVTALIDLKIPGLLGYNLRGYKTRLTLGGSAFLSSGSNPTTFYQPSTKMAITLNKHVDWVTEWRYYGFAETFYLYQSFRSQMVTTGVRLSR